MQFDALEKKAASCAEDLGKAKDQVFPPPLSFLSANPPLPSSAFPAAPSPLPFTTNASICPRWALTTGCARQGGVERDVEKDREGLQDDLQRHEESDR